MHQPIRWKTAALILILPILVVAGYQASCLPPSPIVVEQGAWKYTIASDPIAGTRLALIALGLVFPIPTAAIAFRLIRRKRTKDPLFGFLVALTLACLAIGWRSMPYWANGVYQTDVGAFPYYDLDPKALPPMKWIGFVWFPVVAIYPWALVAFTLALPWVLIRSRHAADAGAFSLLTFAAILCAWLSLVWRIEDYSGWFLD